MLKAQTNKATNSRFVIINLALFSLFYFSSSLLFDAKAATPAEEINTKSENQRINSRINSKDASSLLLTKEELAKVKLHGPWPPRHTADVSNRFSTNETAITFGKTLFFSQELSLENNMSCASCHAVDAAFASGEFIKNNPKALDRNVQSLFNVKFNRWFGWDGSNDNLWAQSIRPITNPKEMNLPEDKIKSIMSKTAFKTSYQTLFGDISSHSNELILVNVGKALSAFQETLITEKTPFDHFRDAVENEDWATANRYSTSAQRGLSLFLGRGNCSFCHSGPLFSNGEFHDAGVPYFIKLGLVDKGRHQGIINVKKSKFTLASDHNDDASKSGAWAINNVATLHSNFGIFRVPGLRGVTKTAPYMHNGSLPSLEAVIDHYNNIDIERLHADGEAILKPLKLSEQEANDLLNFLKSLSN